MYLRRIVTRRWPSRLSAPEVMITLGLILLASYVYCGGVFVSGSRLHLGADIVVDTGYARYLGNQSYPNVVAHLGIPYAEPPLGDLRFRAPLPLNETRAALSTKGTIVDATTYPTFCIQGTTGAGDAGGAGSEDCLKLNIYSPVGAGRGSLLPVLVYIHGGGYIYGNPANFPLDHWVHQSPNVVIVSVYYRLDSFGFLSTPAFRDSTHGDFNAGFLDQIEALKWVRKNIASFGGDPRKVTINGQSAGGSSTELHLVAKQKEKLFSGVIAQSVARMPLPTPEQQEPLFNFYANRAGCGEGLVAEQLACLRNASVSVLAMAQDAARTSAFITPCYNRFIPVVDGKLIVDFPTKSILEGNFVKVPLIVGATTNETTIRNISGITAALKSSYPSLTESDVNALVEAYPVSDFGTPALQFQTLTGDVQLRCARSIMGTAFDCPGKSWTYRYNQPNPTVPGPTVNHAAENWMMFKGTNTGFNGTTTFTPMTPTENAFAEELIAYWLSFVRSGDPNTFKLKRSPIWPSFKEQKARFVLQQGPGNSTNISGCFWEHESSVETKRCKLIASQVERQQN